MLLVTGIHKFSASNRIPIIFYRGKDSWQLRPSYHDTFRLGMQAEGDILAYELPLQRVTYDLSHKIRISLEERRFRKLSADSSAF